MPQIRGCVICNTPMCPLKIQDPRDKRGWVYGWKCKCTDKDRPETLPQITIKDLNEKEV